MCFTRQSAAQARQCRASSAAASRARCLPAACNRASVGPSNNNDDDDARAIVPCGPQLGQLAYGSVVGGQRKHRIKAARCVVWSLDPIRRHRCRRCRWTINNVPPGTPQSTSLSPIARVVRSSCANQQTALGQLCARLCRRSHQMRLLVRFDGSLRCRRRRRRRDLTCPQHVRPPTNKPARTELANALQQTPHVDKRRTRLGQRRSGARRLVGAEQRRDDASIGGVELRHEPIGRLVGAGAARRRLAVPPVEHRRDEHRRRRALLRAIVGRARAPTASTLRRTCPTSPSTQRSCRGSANRVCVASHDASTHARTWRRRASMSGASTSGRQQTAAASGNRRLATSDCAAP